jgi:hypothetical protein
MQRKITLESLDLVQAQLPQFHLFNELLVHYPAADSDRPKPQQVVPDNMVVLHDGTIDAEGSYDVPLQRAGQYTAPPNHTDAGAPLITRGPG